MKPKIISEAKFFARFTLLLNLIGLNALDGIGQQFHPVAPHGRHKEHKTLIPTWYRGMIFKNNGDTVATQIGSNGILLVKDGIYEKPFENVYAENQISGYRIFTNTGAIDYLTLKGKSGYFKVLSRGKLDILSQGNKILIKKDNVLYLVNGSILRSKKASLIKKINTLCSQNFIKKDFNTLDDALQWVINYSSAI